MKSTIFRKVLNEEYIEVHKSVSETIKCLCEQSGESYNETPDGMNIHFECLKNGKVMSDAAQTKAEAQNLCTKCTMLTEKLFLKIIKHS